MTLNATSTDMAPPHSCDPEPSDPAPASVSRTTDKAAEGQNRRRAQPNRGKPDARHVVDHRREHHRNRLGREHAPD
ncbi:hypothetical protein GCM10023194_50170 [Planotetraspora phitsanulokensis]|uniref:Uncharacterized protein n=1 Tax=Planotetraspora phitsanulokensis TaxID=575192 RepID=A0A8J3XDR8_9ACTN|nr:hypothetical protein Pph01_19070 [Planotetraspora phitsanulokensis]